GAVGYFGYDMVRFIEKIPDKNPDRFEIPDSFFIITDTLLVFDHLKRKILIVANSAVDDYASPSAAFDAAVRRIDAEALKLSRGRLSVRGGRRDSGASQAGPIESNFSLARFKEAVLKAKRYIKSGDIIQVVLSRTLKTKTRASALDIYRGLRSINPSPYMFYLDCGNFKLVGSSPEVHVRCEAGKAMLRPIAGTRPRGADARQDAKLARELLADPKERAEHVMLVDLGRNDLGRVCQYRSVRVPEFMVIERYSHVMHIVSLVEGLLKKGKNAFDLLRATFPAGTVSGAPKIRAMEIIEELETQKRSFYAGVVGYFSFSGNLDSCIAIRTFLIKNKTAIAQAGAGIVADSVPEREYLETQNKARALFKAVELAESGALS
ncbi:MAG: chorismate-binding protein, partial [Candidatus Omnitrophota bacterium]